MSFINDDFLLSNPTAQRLYECYAASQPILDYHCHLSPKDIAENRQFKNLFEIWLEGDHYKWRAMRANGVDERYCTGDAPPFEKFMAWARTVPHTLRNPLYHWTHLELKRYFGIGELLDEHSAQDIWEGANALLATDELRAHGILKKFHVKALCTTDDPTDDLAWHKTIAESGLATRVYPTFRPDKALNVHLPDAFKAWVDRLAAASNIEISTFPRFLDAIRNRHDHFHAMGGRLSDHGLNHCYADFCSDQEAGAIFGKARAGSAASPEEQRRFASFMMLFFGKLDAEKGWTKQIHLGDGEDRKSTRLNSSHQCG
jgi:glucuronate isomerase